MNNPLRIAATLIGVAASAAIANPAQAGGFNRTSTDLSTTEQSQTNVTTQDSLGIINQKGGDNFNFQNNNAYDPVYHQYGTQRCAVPNLVAKVYGGASDNYSTTAFAGGEIAVQVPLGDGGCKQRIAETHCAALFKLELTNDRCDAIGLRKFTGFKDEEAEPEDD